MQMNNTIYEKFVEWFQLAEQKELNDPNGMAIATAEPTGRISNRMVLMKAHSPAGIVFYTNFESDKGRALTGNPHIAALFHWKSIRRQIRIEGLVSKVSDEEADEYFHSRPRDSQIGAWASKQSRPLRGRAELLARIGQYTLEYPTGTIPRPPYWHGFLINPNRIEFWQDKPFRLHERQVWVADDNNSDDNWNEMTLYP